MITLSPQQEQAKQEFMSFLSDDSCKDFVLEGFAGTGKSTLVSILLDESPKMLAAIQLITQNHIDWEIICSATTNKAAEVFQTMSGKEVKTVHKTLGLRLHKDYKNNTTKTVEIDREHKIRNTLLFIDEASYLDTDLIQMIKKKCVSCKIVYIGDPAQLAPVGKSVAPIFSLGFRTASLTSIMRQEKGNPIIEMSARCRDVVNGHGWFQMQPDNNHLVYLDRPQFQAEILKEFSRPDRRSDCAKVLAYTNRTVIDYNKAIRSSIHGLGDIQVGDYAIVNKAISNKHCKLTTDTEVCITNAVTDMELNVPGREITMNSNQRAFLPDSLDDKKARLKKARKDEDWAAVQIIEDSWVDLRSAFACTINKSQGSTYDRVFIDLDDVAKCRSGNQMARLMYVAVSRARYNVYFTGNLTRVANAA